MDDSADAGAPDEAAGAPDPEDLANQAAMDNWDRVVADMEATAAEYEEAGWDTLQLHPGDVAVLGEDDRGPGFDVVIPDPEYADLADVFASGAAVDETTVYRASLSGVTYLVVVLQHADGTAVLVPLYYRIGDGDVEAAFRRADAGEEFRLRLRTLTGDQVVVGHDEYELFAPAADGDEDG